MERRDGTDAGDGTGDGFSAAGRRGVRARGAAGPADGARAGVGEGETRYATLRSGAASLTATARRAECNRHGGTAGEGAR
ncbi:DUF6380 family protein [Streptomyces sp. NPDC058417]|uniref:DUF6380 family protein n=1 Tax=unclassified Streptomyces TaxID=2593676 RepID=UPI0036553DF4